MAPHYSKKLLEELVEAGSRSAADVYDYDPLGGRQQLTLAATRRSPRQGRRAVGFASERHGDPQGGSDPIEELGSMPTHGVASPVVIGDR
eukprot:Skav232151  [mRNA]  locus=scaffold1040:255898:256872:- [translate_table: standard]